MKFLSCRDEGSIRTEEQDPTEKRALLNASSATCVPGTPGSDGLGGGATPDTSYKPVKLRVFSLTELETATGGFGKTSLIGKGSHGRLYKGLLKDGRVVAIKRQEFLQDEAAFNNELEFLSTLHGPRFVNLVGFSRGMDAQEKLLVVDYMANGTLYDALHHRNGGSPGSGNNNSGHSARHSTTSSSCSSVSSVVAAGPLAEPLSWPLRVQIALQMAKALLALHSASPPVIHRDVKSSSVFIDSKWNAKLGDFGLALRGRSEEDLRGKGSEGGEGRLGAGDGEGEATGDAAAGIVDPEEDDTPGSRISTKVDVFSFGILLLEILSGRNAIDARFKPPSIIDWALPLIKQGKAHAIYDRRLILLPHYSKALRLMAGIAARCVRRCSVRRPSMNDVVAALQDVSKKIPMAKWADGLATVMKMTTSGCQTPHVLRDVRAGPELNSSIHNHQRRNSVSPASRGGGMTAAQIAKQRQAVDRPMPAGKALPLPPPHKALEQQDYYMNVALNRFVSRANSMDRAAASIRSREPYRGGSTRKPRELDFVAGLGQGQSGANYHHYALQRSLSRQDSKRNDTHRQYDGEDEDEDDNVAVDEAAKRLPRATMEVSLGNRKRIYNQWRNPIFDVETGSPPERPLMVPVEVARPLPSAAQRVAHGDRNNAAFRSKDDAAAYAEGRAATGGGVTHRQSSTTITTRIVPSSSTPPPAPTSAPASGLTSALGETPATSAEGPTCMPAIPLSMSNKVRSRNVRSSSRKSHIKTRDNFEREEAMLPW